MRLICMFDLPMETADEKRRYRQFRKNLLREGFIMMQFSVYIRTCPNKDFVTRMEKRIQKIVPPEGNIRLVTITEKQYQNIKLLIGSKSLQEEAMGTERLVIF